METSSRPLFQAVLAVRVLGIPLASIVDAVPDFVLAGMFLYGVLRPEKNGVSTLHWLAMVMLVEFLIVHASFFMGMQLLSTAPRKWRVISVLGLSLFYIGFAVGMGEWFQSWSPAMAIGGLTVNRLLFILFRDPNRVTPIEAGDIGTQWAFGCASYVFSLMIGALLFRLFGAALWSPEIHSQYFVLRGDENGTLDVPVLAGVLYFTAQGVRELLFARDLGVPGYAHQTTAIGEHRVFLGIHARLWYLLFRQALMVLTMLTFLSVFAVFGGLVGLIFLLFFTSLIVIAQVFNIRWLQQATKSLLRGQFERMLLHTPQGSQDSRSITEVELRRQKALDAKGCILHVEPVRRRNFLAPDAHEILAEVYRPDSPTSPTVIRIGQTFLCECFPTTPKTEEEEAE